MSDITVNVNDGNNENIVIDVSSTTQAVDTDVISVKSNVSSDVSGDKYYTDLAKEWAIKMDGKVLGQDYSSKYYAGQAANSASDASNAVDGFATTVTEATQQAINMLENTKTTIINELGEEETNIISDLNTEKINIIDNIQSEGDNQISIVAGASANYISEMKVIENNTKDYASSASNNANIAVTSATNAANSAATTEVFANNAQVSAENASTSASNAETYANNISSYVTVVSNYATNARTYASSAMSSASAAANSADNASKNESSTRTYMESANTYASQANIYAANANTSATNAANSASTAATSENNAEIWAEGTDAQVQALGGLHSAKKWAEQSASGQINADWEETDSTSKAYIFNKPDLSTKQDVLTAGTGITIENNVISATASGNFVTLDTEQYITAPKAFLGEYTMIAPAYDTETGTDPTLYFGVDAYNGITGLSTGTKGVNFTNQNSAGDTVNMITQQEGILSCYGTKDSGQGTEAISQFYQTPNQIVASAANVGVNIYGPDNQVYISTNMASFTFADNGLTLPTQSISTSYGNDIAVTYGLLTGKLAEKQDTISDIATIRSGAALGATALQPNDNISELTNDAGYITNTALSGYATETWVTNQGFASNTDLTNGLATKQDILTAGTNIQINNNVISATDTTYSAGSGINITDGVISNTRTTLEWGNLTGTLSDQTDLQDELDLKANAADVNIALNDKADTDLSNTASILSDSFLFKILPDWDNGIIMGLPEKPVSTTTTTFTAPANGICNISGMRSPSGNSLNIYVNNKHIANWAAYSAFSCSILFPVSKGDIVLAKTDSTSATWVLNIKAFYPLKGAN